MSHTSLSRPRAILVAALAAASFACSPAQEGVTSPAGMSTVEASPPRASAPEVERSIDPLAAPALLAAHAALRAARELGDGVEPSEPPGPAACEHMRETILAGGEPLRRAALDALVGADDERRLLAGLVLQTAELTPQELAWLRDHGDEVARLWYALSLHGPEEPPAPRDASTPGDLAEACELLNECTGDLKSRFLLSDEELETWNEEYLEAYHRVLVPNLEEPGSHVDELTARRADLDGDGVDDWLILGALDDGWGAARFALVADGATRRALVVRELDHDFRRGSIAAHDATGAGELHVLVEGSIVAGWSWREVLHLSPPGVRNVYKRDTAAFVLQLGEGDPIWVVDGDAYNPANSGKSAYLSSAYGGEWRLTRLDDPSVQLTLHTGRSPW